MIRQTARFRIRPEAMDEVLSAIDAFIDHIRANEPGTISYRSWQEVQDPTQFVHVFEFEDEKAQEIHSSSDAVRRFTDVLYPQTIGGVEFTTYVEVAGSP